MLVACWSPKGGTGTTVLSAALALNSPPALLVDLAGDLAAALGVAGGELPGVGDWLVAARSAPPDALARLEVPVTTDVGLLPTGSAPVDGAEAADVDLLVGLLRAQSRTVVVDAGTPGPVGRAVVGRADRSLVALRPCYLALRRLTESELPATGILLVTEPGRALSRRDVEQATGVPVVATVPWDPAIGRAVDAGVLADRRPRVLDRPLRGLAA